MGGVTDRRRFSGRPRPVLVVDDHDDSRQMVADFLESIGIPAVTAANADEAIAKLQETKPCLVLLELWSPMQGDLRAREEQRHLAAYRLAGVPIVILSAVRDDDQIRTLGAVAFLKKPIDFDRLMDVLWKHVIAA